VTIVTVVGTTDRQLEELLTTDKIRVQTAPDAGLIQLAHPDATQPHALVIDLRDRAALPEALTALKRQHPSTGVVIVAARLEPTLMLEAMRAGVNEWVSDPVSQSDLLAAIERVTATRRPVVESSGPRGEVFAFLGAKGGVGTTTVAVNVATALAAISPASVLIVDLHQSHGDAGLFLGVEPKFSVLDALENSHRLDRAFLKSLVVHAKCGPDLLASSERSGSGRLDPGGIRSLIELAASTYRYVVLDVPRHDLGLIDALDEIRTLVLVANQELATVRSTAKLAATLRQRFGRERVRVVMTRYDQNAAIGQDDVEKVVGGAVTHLFPNNYRLAVDALHHGRPVVVENHNKLASSLVGFARGLAGVKEQPAPPRSPGLFGRLSGKK
jgi:pilus assembly protein CpaE